MTQPVNPYSASNLPTEETQGYAQTYRYLLMDQWTPLSYKEPLGGRRTPSGPGLAPTWVGSEHDRRLTAYKILQSYLDNVSRVFLGMAPAATVKNRREYGDPALLVSTIVGDLLGDEQTIVVDGAEDVLVDLQAEPEAAETADADDDPDADDGLNDQPETKTVSQPADPWAATCQDWLRDWAADEKLYMKMAEVERDAVGLGDGVYLLAWSNLKERPRLRVYDPGFYFPVLTDGNDDDFPSRVHIAWEPAGDPTVVGNHRVRRITFELLPVAEPRMFPWNDKPTSLICHMTDAVFAMTGALTGDVDTFSEANAVFQVNEDGDVVRQMDLDIDFIPVVHVPNTTAVKHHYGRSSLLTILQLLDDIQSNDSDLNLAAATSGSPILAVSGVTADSVTTYGPGQVMEVGEGDAKLLDTSKSLDALLNYDRTLLDRLSVNSRVPQAAVGRLTAGEVPSGIALALSFSPLQQLIREMRQVRDEKYPLLLKMALRMGQRFGNLGVGDLPEGRVTFGSFMPTDQTSTVANVTTLYREKVISLETAITMLMEAGFPVDDIAAEIDRIRREDFDGAIALLDATSDNAVVRKRLGIPGPPPKAPPAVPQVPLPTFVPRPPDPAGTPRP